MKHCRNSQANNVKAADQIFPLVYTSTSSEMFIAEIRNAIPQYSPLESSCCKKHLPFICLKFNILFHVYLQYSIKIDREVVILKTKCT